MPTQVQIRGAVQATQEARTLVSRELDVNTTDKRISVHDGSTAGGIQHVNSFDAQNQEYTYAAGSGTNAITASYTVAPTAYASGQKFAFKAANTNTGSTTLNVNSLGAKTIKKISGGSLVSLGGGEIVQNSIYEVAYDGTDFILLNKDISEPIAVARTDGSSVLSQSGTNTVSLSSTTTGEFTFTFGSTESNDDYVVIGNADDTGIGTGLTVSPPISQSTTAFTVEIRRGDNGFLRDPDLLNVAVFRATT